MEHLPEGIAPLRHIGTLTQMRRVTNDADLLFLNESVPPRKCSIKG